MTMTNKQLRDALRAIRGIALDMLGPDYPQTLPLGMNHLHEIVTIATAVLAGGPFEVKQ